MSYDPTLIYKPNFGIGARVKVVRCPNKYSRRGKELVGLVGTVRTDSGSNVSVGFVEVRNSASGYGCFYFKPSDLVAVDENGNEIKEEKNMPKITNYFNAVKIQFIGDSSPCNCVYANYDPGIQPGDLCVVKPANHVMNLAKVVKVYDVTEIDPCTTELQREIVAKVWTDEYDNRVAMRAKAAEIKAKMEARAKQLQDIALYQMLAKEDHEMAQMLQEYQSLPKV